MQEKLQTRNANVGIREAVHFRFVFRASHFLRIPTFAFRVSRQLDSTGKTAPSFIATLAVLALLVAGYLAWEIYRPNPIARSEMVVREFNSSAAAEIGPLRRALRDEVQRYNSNPESLEDVRGTIDDLVADARANVEYLADGARDQIEVIEGIGLRTQENRLGRVRRVKEDALSRIDRLASEVRAKLPETGP
jgi:hypothetical protein